MKEETKQKIKDLAYQIVILVIAGLAIIGAVTIINDSRSNKEKNKGDKLYIVRKYIFAKNAKDAIKKDKITPVDDVWVDDDFKKLQPGASAIGFTK